MSEARRYFGLELAGAKNQKTSIAIIEYYPKEKKIFLLDIFDKITPLDKQTGDQAVIELIQELTLNPTSKSSLIMGVNVPLDLPPCIVCTQRTCPLPAHCIVPTVKWMKETSIRASRTFPQETEKARKIRDFTPYTQRPIELWIRHHVFPLLTEEEKFDIDETLGGNRGPLSARMHFLKRHLHSLTLIEVWPKLSTSLLASQLKLHKNIISSYRHLENGAHCREELIQQLSVQWELFIYERDMRKLSLNLTAFDAFICAFTALLSDRHLCAPPPPGFPSSAGWVHYPKIT